jgi:glycosyltransferase involved in cell wall biosynthesis
MPFRTGENIQLQVRPRLLSSLINKRSFPMALPRVLRIFSRYQQSGGEETVVQRIHQELEEVMDADWFESSTGTLLGSSLGARLAAPWKAVHNRTVAGTLRKLQESNQYCAWEIHNVFPALSPSVYQTAFDLQIPVVHFLHNYRLSCVNGSFINHGEPCLRCIKGNFLPAVQTICWRDSRIACGFMSLALTRVRHLKVFERISAWIALSQAHKALHLQMGLPDRTLHVVPHFQEFRQSEVSTLPQNGYALFLGRLSPEKGLVNLIEGWKQVKTAGARLVIAGTGPEESRLRRFIAENKLDSVELRGYVDRAQHRELWANAKFLIVPSIWHEPFGLVVLESFAHGRPLVVSSLGSLSEIAGDGGLVVNPARPEEIAHACDRLFGETKLAEEMGARGIKRLQQLYNRAIWLERIREVYGSCGIRLPGGSPN